MKKYKYISIFLICLNQLTGQVSFAQKSYTDSLLMVLKSAKTDTLKVKIKNLIGFELIHKNTDSAYTIFLETKAFSEKINYSLGLMNSLSNLGNVFYARGDYNKALSYYLKALKISEKNNSKYEIAVTKGNIGLLYSDIGEYKKSLSYYLEALPTFKSLNQLEHYATILNNIGLVYWELDSNKIALNYHEKALKIREDKNDSSGIASSLGNIALIYSDAENFKKSLEYNLKALNILEKINDKRFLARVLENIGEDFQNEAKYTKAIDFFLRAELISKEIDFKENLKLIYSSLSETYFLMKDYKSAYDYSILHFQTNESIFNTESNNQIKEMQTKYETEKKEQQIALLNKDKALQKTELNKQQIVIWSVIGGLILVVALAGFIFRSYSQIKRKNSKISHQKQIIEEKQKEILDSIHYAKRIQIALLPSEKYINKKLSSKKTDKESD